VNENQIVKRVAAIIFSLLLVWMQIAPAPVSAASVCVKSGMDNCADSCDRMPCCVTKPVSNSQPVVPADPLQSSAQNQISLLAPSVVAWTFKDNPASSISSVSASPLMAMAAPIYARNCALLL
jgi:hypothetical protein